MFLDVGFCEDNHLILSKMYHLPSMMANPDRVAFDPYDSLSNDMDGCQNQLVLTEKTKQLADILDSCYEDNLDKYDTLERLYLAGFQKGCIFELTIPDPKGFGRYVLFTYAESEKELRDFAQELANKVWGELDGSN